ncbi:hypothetical protein HZB00_00185, partial [Candidatus Woesearchaeota archaeon]|nr:hypothetical protein [Candidatus Woesearchaeota archaeon]
EFLGHCIFAMMQYQRFVEMLTAMTGIAGPLALKLIVVIGIIDISIAVLMLFFPFRLLVGYAALWGFLTALARPIAGDPIWDFVERWANWGAPLALLILRGFPRKLKEWFRY